jgi:hypothetical protein
MIKTYHLTNEGAKPMINNYLYQQYLLYAKNNGFPPMKKSAFDSFINAGFIFTSNGLQAPIKYD